MKFQGKLSDTLRKTSRYRQRQSAKVKSSKLSYLPRSKPKRSSSPRTMNRRLMTSITSLKTSFKAKSAANKSRNSSKNSRMSEKPSSSKKKKSKRKTLLFQRRLTSNSGMKSYIDNLKQLSSMGTPKIKGSSILGKDGISSRLFFKRKISGIGRNRDGKRSKKSAMRTSKEASKMKKNKASFTSKFDKSSGILNDLPFELNRGKIHHPSPILTHV